MRQVKVSISRFGNTFFLFVCCLVWFAFFTGVAHAQFTNTVTGFVFDSQRNPVAQVHVELQNEINQTLQRTRTNNSGRFFFSGLSAGRFNIRVLPLGTNFEEQTQEVEIINFVRGGTTTSDNAYKDFYLRLRKDYRNTDGAPGTLFAQEVPPDAQKSYNRAVDAFEEKKDEIAVQELLNALKTFPDYYQALERLGREYIKQQKYDLAQAVFTKSVSVNPRSFTGWYGLSFSSYALGMSTMAIEAGQKAVEVDSTSVEGNLILGISFRQAKKYTEAEKALIQAKKVAKVPVPDVHWNLALLYNYNLKRYKQAADELELYLKNPPEGVNTATIKKLISQLREMQQSSKK